MIALCLVDNADLCAMLFKFLGDTFADTICTTGDDGYFVVKHKISTSQSRYSLILQTSDQIP